MVSLNSIDNLIALPSETLCTKENNDTTAFFQKGSPFSNHHQCNFVVDGERFNCVQQYLMAAKAELFGNHHNVVSIKSERGMPELKKVLEER